MTSILQHLYMQTEEARESYEEINKRLDEIVDGLDTISVRLKELEERVNLNRNQDIK